MADDGDHETLRVGDTFPNVSCNTTHGIITSMHQHFGSSWALVVTQPEEGNAVGLTELGELERMKHEFAARKVQVYVISCADAGANEDWLRDVHSATGYSVSFPVIHDGDFEICKKLGMMPPGGAPDDEGRLRDLLRGVYLVDTAKRVRVIMHYPASVGWSSYEILRCFDALFRADAQLATPVNWIARRPRPPCFAARARDAPPQEGRDAFLQPEVETSDALRDFPRGLRSIEVPSGQDYLRLTADPRDPALNRDDLAKDGSLKFRRGSRSSLDEVGIRSVMDTAGGLEAFRGSRGSGDLTAEPDEASAEVTLDGEDDNTFS
ncbi:peroxiredoxin [Aureococcus anophagefferens]|uniref:Peroxiredoxin n=1 Tax=Aureococcus anophagefferens TaxID=44056 RepID=A0ABR1G8R7_AURAN